jgi:hypothetical protein
LSESRENILTRRANQGHESIVAQRFAPTVIARSEATKQSIYPLCRDMDCFAALAMTRMVRSRYAADLCDCEQKITDN